ncbi:TetR/AcrR family transcriptional regulator [Actinoplanes sp. M2I2]|uniref:TetR/AcrR family transcriptional regulator n=1 Tax=Actinoplanes sp. M2I2 TaxID=1734444 RepID=UPI0020212AD8|nr:TetR/AcrR family transcriptional regulator [Actinoplanes sp. M2I2]
MKASRGYTQSARAESAAATRQRILEATVAAFGQLPEVTLAGVAALAGVSVQTVLRHFGNRDALIAQAASMLADERAAPAGDPAHAIQVLYNQYESRGDANIRLLGKEDTTPHVKHLMDRGRAMHRDWVEQVFAPNISGLAPVAREALIDLLIVATDVYTWKVLRRDRRLSRRSAESRVQQLVERILQ